MIANCWGASIAVLVVGEQGEQAPISVILSEAKDLDLKRASRFFAPLRMTLFIEKQATKKASPSQGLGDASLLFGFKRNRLSELVSCWFRSGGSLTRGYCRLRNVRVENHLRAADRRTLVVWSTDSGAIIAGPSLVASGTT